MQPSGPSSPNERELADFFENAPIALHWVGSDGTILRANRAELELLGYARDAYVGQPLSAFHADAEGLAAMLRRLQAGETLRDHPARLRRKDGSILDVLVSSNALFEDGRLVQIRCVTRDVTESVRSARRLSTQDAVTRILAGAQTLAQAAPRVLEVMCEHLGWDVGGLWSADPERAVLSCVDVWHRPSTQVPEFEAETRSRTFAPGIGLPGRVWSQGEVVWIPDVTRDENFPRAAVALRAGLHGACGFPIVLKDEVRGVIEFFSREIRRPEADQIAMLTAVGSQLGQVIERERALHSSRASEQRFAWFMRNLPGLAWIKDRHGRYVYANDAALKAFQTSRESLYGRTDEEVFPPKVAAQFREHDREALASASGLQVIESLAHADGIVHHSLVSKFPILDAAGQPVMVGGMAIDITDRLRAERELQGSRERLELAQQASGIGTFEWVLGTDEVNWSEAEERLYGLPPGGFGGRYESWRQAVHPDDRERAEAEVQRAVRDAAELDTEFRILWPDGNVRWIAAKGRVFCDEAGIPVRMLGVNLDVTERKQAEEALREADRRKDEFLATLAHELRNPLSPIRNGLQILRESRAGDPTAEGVRVMLERQVEHMVRLVDDLLEVSRITRGKIELRKERVLLAEVVNGALETCRPLLDARGHELRVHLPPEPLTLDADPVRLTQVLANLLNNAAKYTDPGGHVDVRVVRREGEVEISVRDDGIGIPAEMLSRIFDMFTQADRSLTRAQGGLGIGLTLVKTLVQMHGGRVSARSSGTRQGSEFSIVLPLAREPEPVPDSAEGLRPSARAAPGQRVLIVDDNQDAAESLQILLQRLGSEAHVVHDGPTALAALGAYDPSVVLLDIGMPGMDGYEVARRIRARPRQPTLLIALTGWGQEEDRRLALEAGFDHHLRKPVDLGALRELLAKAD